MQNVVVDDANPMYESGANDLANGAASDDDAAAAVAMPQVSESVNPT